MVKPVVPPKLVSVVIPTFNEQDYIPDTIEKLSKQTLFPQAEIVIGDYDPQNNGLTRNAALNTFKRLKLPPDRLKIVYIDRPGIGYARNQAAIASSADILMSFDADAYFDRNDAMWKLVDPVINGECLMSCCLNFLDISNEGKAAILPDVAYKLYNLTELSYEPGLTMTRDVYSRLGGYPDVPMWEGGIFSAFFILKYGASARMQLNDMCIYVSPRRMQRLDKELSLNTVLEAFNYRKAYRTGSVHPIC